MSFNGTCGADLDDWVRAAGIDSVPLIPEPHKDRTNTSRGLLWQDPLLALYDPCVEGMDLHKHYVDLAQSLFAAAAKGGLSGGELT